MNPWGKTAKFSKNEILDLQNRQLRFFINHYVYPFSPHYQKIFNNEKIKPDSIRSIEDLRRIPLISKKNLLATPENPEIYKDFILQPNRELIKKYWPKLDQIELLLTSLMEGKEYLEDQLTREFKPTFITFTTGTTNKPVPFLYSNYDIENLHLYGARMLNTFDVPKTDNIVSMFPYAPHLAFWQVVFGGLEAGNLVLSTGGGKVMGTEGNIATITKMKPSVIIGVPSYVYHVIRCAKEKGCRLDSVKKVVLGASKIEDGFKLKLAELLESMGAKNVSIFGTYGFTEARTAWAECPTSLDVSSGYHLYPEKEIFEIIDPETGEPKKEGEDGELVYTSIDSRGSVMLRYRTGDFVKGGITYAPCPHCKRTVPRISSDIVRLSNKKDLQTSKIKGCLVDMNHFAAILSDDKDIEEWQVELKKKNNDPYDTDEVHIFLTASANASQENLTDRIRRELNTQTEITPNSIQFVPLPEMVKRLELETANKEKRIIDLRPKP
jgi:phenylacetate-coenzyme A ligase PaaK-like adenylate-forming protein